MFIEDLKYLDLVELEEENNILDSEEDTDEDEIEKIFNAREKGCGRA
jgi:hypothetical protein